VTGLAVAVSPLFRPALNGIFCSIFVSAAGCGVEGVLAPSPLLGRRRSQDGLSVSAGLARGD
jgi:hypothetical protein